MRWRIMGTGTTLAVVVVCTACATGGYRVTQQGDCRGANCAPSNDQRTPIRIDVSHGSAQLSDRAHFKRRDRGSIMLVGLNPFRFTYQIQTKTTSTPVTNADVAGTGLPGIPEAEEAKAPSKGDGDPPKTNSGAELFANALLRDGPTVAMSLRDGGAIRPERACSPNQSVRQAWFLAARGISEEMTDLFEGQHQIITTQKAADSRASALRKIVDSEQSNGQVLRAAVDAFIAVQRATRDALDSYLPGKTARVDTLASRALAWRNEYEKVQAGLGACLPAIRDELSALHDRMGHILNDSIPRLRGTLANLALRRGPLDDQIRIYESISSLYPDFSLHIQDVGEYDDNTEIVVDVSRTERFGAKPASAKLGSATVSFSERSRFSISAGPTIGWVKRTTFDRISGYSVDSSERKGDSIQSVIGKTEDSNVRVGASVFLHYRLREFDLLQVPMSVQLGLGAGVGQGNGGADFSYMPAASLAFADQWFITVGAYLASTQSLAGNLKEGHVVPTTLSGPLPTTKRQEAGWGIAIGYKLR